MVKPQGTIWLLVDPKGDCNHNSLLHAVSLKDGTLYVGFWAHPVDCPRGAGTRAQAAYLLVTVAPLPTAVTTASVIYSGAESRNNASAAIGD